MDGHNGRRGPYDESRRKVTNNDQNRGPVGDGEGSDIGYNGVNKRPKEDGKG